MDRADRMTRLQTRAHPVAPLLPDNPTAAPAVTRHTEPAPHRPTLIHRAASIPHQQHAPHPQVTYTGMDAGADAAPRARTRPQRPRSPDRPEPPTQGLFAEHMKPEHE